MWKLGIGKNKKQFSSHIESGDDNVSSMMDYD